MAVLIDLHSHSKNSPDAIHSVMEMCNQAKNVGISAYSITDHFECKNENWYDKKSDGTKIILASFKDIFENSMKEIKEAKEYFGDSIEIISGIELGEPTQDFERATKYATDDRLDFVIASDHEVGNHEDFYYLDYEKEDVPRLMIMYFDELYEICKWNKFDVLGHLTLPLRYITGEHGIKVDMKPYTEKIRECYKVLVQNGKGIEINTSGIRQKFGDFLPSFEYVKMFHELGGEVLTIGSDSHCMQDVGKGIKEGIEMASSAGFKYICYFKKHKPIFVKI